MFITISLLFFTFAGKPHDAHVEVKNVQIKGNRYINAGELIGKIQYVMHNNKLRINTSSLVEMLSKHPMIASYKFYSAGESLIIEIIEKDPIFLCAVLKKDEVIPFELDKDFQIVSVQSIHSTDMPIIIFEECDIRQGKLSTKAMYFLKVMDRVRKNQNRLFKELSEIMLRDDGILEIRLKGRKMKCFVKDMAFTTFESVLSVLDAKRDYPEVMYVSNSFGVIK